MKIMKTEGYSPCMFREDGTTYVETFVTNAREGVIRPRSRPVHSFATMPVHASPVGQALTALEAVGIPVEEAAEGLERAQALKRQARAPVEEASPREFEHALASGKMTPAAFEKKLATATVPDVDTRPSLRNASEVAYREAHAFLAGVGDALIEGPLADQVQVLLDEPDADRWRAVWSAVDALRDGSFASRVLMAPRTAELYVRPHAARFWALRTAESRDRHAVESTWSERRGKYTLLRSRIRPDKRHVAPNPTSLAVAAEHGEAWGARLLTADEIDHNLTAIFTAERELA